MLFIYGAAFVAWLYLWLRGFLWAAVPVPILMCALEWVSYSDQHHFDPRIGLAWMVAFSVAAFIPYAVHRRRAIRMDRALNGLRLRDVD